MGESYAPSRGRWLLRAVTCVLLVAALLASFCMPPASAVSGWLGSAWADEPADGGGTGGADGDESEDDDDNTGDADNVAGAKVVSAERPASTTVQLPGSKIKKEDRRYLYTHGKFTLVIAEGAGGFGASKVPSAKCTGGKTSSFKCASYVKVTFGIAVEKAAKSKGNANQPVARADGKKVFTGAEGSAKLSNYLKEGEKALIGIESTEAGGDRAGDADAPAIEFKGDTENYRVYGDYGSKGYKDVAAIKSNIVMNMKADEDSLSVANKIPLVYKNKAADQVFWQRGKDGGNTEGGNNKDGKLYSMHRYAFYVDNGNGTNSYEDYTGYNFIHGKSGATSCEKRDCELNVTINLGSTGVIGATHWKNAGTASNPKAGGIDHFDRIVNPWGVLKMKQPGEKLKVDLGGGSLESLGASEADNKLFTNYTLKGTKAENEKGAKESKSFLQLANGSTVTLGVPTKEGAKFLGWAWSKVDKNFDGTNPAGQNRTDYSDNKFAAPYAKKIASSDKTAGSLKHCAKDLSKIEGAAANADGKSKTPITDGDATATITIENGYQTLAKSKSNGANHNNGWLKCPQVTRSCTVYRAVWSDDNLHTLSYDIDGTVVGWFTDKSCKTKTSSKGYTVKEGATLTYYGYTKHKIDYIVNGKLVASDEVRVD